MRKALVEWLASLLSLPLFALLATQPSPSPYRKPEIGMWQILISRLNAGLPVALGASSFVGDMAGREGDLGNSDREFALRIGAGHGGALRFSTPEEAFGPPSGIVGGGGGGGGGGGRSGGVGGSGSGAPLQALRARAALLGGYSAWPLLLILCGPQGAGKSTFCEMIVGGGAGAGAGAGVLAGVTAAGGAGAAVTAGGSMVSGWPATSGAEAMVPAGAAPWVVVCQDTIAKGKPGKREACEALATASLRSGRSVIVDRTHLTPAQRAYFLSVAAGAGAAAHVLVLLPSRAEVGMRVRERVGHPGGVEGASGAAMAVRAWDTMSLPEYSEGFELITVAKAELEVAVVAALYRGWGSAASISGSAGRAATGAGQNVLGLSPPAAGASQPLCASPYPLVIVGGMGGNGGGAAGGGGVGCGAGGGTTSAAFATLRPRTGCDDDGVGAAGVMFVAGAAGGKRAGASGNTVGGGRAAGGGAVASPSGILPAPGAPPYAILPAVALGTMDLKGDALRRILALSWAAVDTAPTYKNETDVGRYLQSGAGLIAKVPRSATGDGQGERREGGVRSRS
jgi:hypothetical protein